MIRAETLSPVIARTRILWMSTIAFTVCFAAWTIFSIIGIRIKQQLGLSEAEFGLLLGTPILTGSLIRIVLGIWASRYGGRLVYTATMLATALATFLLVFATTYPEMLLAALGIGVAGGSFAVGIAYVSAFFPSDKQGTALGIFGAGNVGAAVTKFLAPFVLLAFGWQAVAEIWAAALAVVAVVFWFTTEDEPARDHATQAGPRRSFLDELAPLKELRVWRFALYYFFAFGGFVALALWLPRYLVGVYGFDLETAGMLAALYSVPASVFRAYGGILSDRIGARKVMYLVLTASAATCLLLALPASPRIFVTLIFLLGFVMSLGKAAVYKHIPIYYPENVGAVGGLVGMIGGLGGFVLPIAFGVLEDATGLWSSCFLLLFLLAAGALLWMHLTIRALRPAPQPAVAVGVQV